MSAYNGIIRATKIFSSPKNNYHRQITANRCFLMTPMRFSQLSSRQYSNDSKWVSNSCLIISIKYINVFSYRTFHPESPKLPHEHFKPAPLRRSRAPQSKHIAHDAAKALSALEEHGSEHHGGCTCFFDIFFNVCSPWIPTGFTQHSHTWIIIVSKY